MIRRDVDEREDAATDQAAATMESWDCVLDPDTFARLKAAMPAETRWVDEHGRIVLFTHEGIRLTFGRVR